MFTLLKIFASKAKCLDLANGKIKNFAHPSPDKMPGLIEEREDT